MMFLGWGKASKCKKLIKQVQCRLKWLKDERSALSKQLQAEVVDKVTEKCNNTLDKKALKARVGMEHIIRDECVVYELLSHYCKLILMHFFYIRMHKQCRQRNLIEAVSSLVFASSRFRCGAIPELEEIRDLFTERYGESFTATAVQLLPGNLVNAILQKNVLAVSPKSVVPNNDENQLQLITLPASFHVIKPSFTDSSLEQLALERSSSLEDKDENRGQDDHLQLIPLESVKHVHPKLPDCDEIYSKFSALKRPKHVHPKLPDYDDITAKLSALKNPNMNVNTPDNYELQLEYHDHDYIGDRVIFNYSWLDLEREHLQNNKPAPMLLTQSPPYCIPSYSLLIG
ncbi:hypothetical protein M0R45_030620 [Rubus argutus]|uniref:IST1 homolog n=1 Tax=Rubus argutus TaxID=59490 RepID=A0AAW1WFW2_RUBAR